MLKHLAAAVIAATVLAAPALSVSANAAQGFATSKVVVVKHKRHVVLPHKRVTHERHWRAHKKHFGHVRHFNRTKVYLKPVYR